MLTADTKRHIDAARQVLVGIVPDPKGQVDQITNALIYKFMDDMDQASLRMKGGKASFFTGDLEMFAWTRLMDSSLGNQGRMNLYVEALNKFATAKQLPELFRDIFKRAVLPYRDPETLGLFLKEIAYFDYSHSEELGNAYEYLLSIMGSQGDAGQFRTPRHIIDFIVAAVDPTKDDTVLDPACGTAGFLISAYKHIVAKHDGKDENGNPKKETPLTPDERKRLMEHFEGYDISPDMVRMSQVNMYLHAFRGPKISEYNTLASEDRWNDKFDVILANPPFMSPKGGVRPHQRFSVESTRAEVLFVDYIMNHLKPRGRAGVIVPEGIIFQSGTAYKQLRKNLVDDGLHAVVSLPAGVFNPYSGVKTSILLFDRELAKRATELLFVKVSNDGYDLGAQRREHTHNDLPQALEILHKWKSGKKVENAMALYVEKSEIGKTGDYNLSGDRYRVATDYGTAKWPIVELGDVCDVYQPKTITSKEITESGKYKVYGANGVIGYFNEYNHEDGEVAVTCRGATCGTVNFTEPLCWITGNAMVVKPKDTKLNKRFLYHLLRSTDLSSVITGAAQPQITGAALKPFKIPLPPLEIQQQIVAELDGYSAIITGAQQVAENWKPQIDIDPAWEKVRIGTVCNILNGYAFKSENYVEGGIRVMRITNVQKGEIVDDNPKFYPPNSTEPIGKYKLISQDLLLSLTGNVGRVGILPQELLPAALNQRVACLRVKNEILSPKFLFSLLNMDSFENDCIKASSGVAQKNLSTSWLADYEIPFPPLEIQLQIVEQIESERTLVESAKKLIAIYEQKTKDTIAKLWKK